MFRRTLTVLIAAVAFAGSAMATDLPRWYPQDGFQRTGQIDDIHLDRNVIVIDDSAYRIADGLIVHSLSSYSDSVARLRPGTVIGYKTAGGATITEIWLLPKNFADRRRRR